MKKIGIITINDFNNYGNRLQCYAVQHYLERMGYCVENIYNEYSSDSFISKSIKGFVRNTRDLKNRKAVTAREKNFQEFNELIHFSENSIINGKHNKELNEQYDYFITGSDQVWNPCDSGRSGTDFLTFASACKRISFSASMGVGKIPDEKKEIYSQYLKDFKRISVREESAKQIINELTDRTDVEVLVDPTMLLTVDDWKRISKKPDYNLCSKYILTYFLGGIKEHQESVKSIAKKYSCEIIDIYDKNSIFYTCGPQHFLHLIENAFLICTDSFHAAVFSFLYNRPFIVFKRDNTKMDMNPRMETFLSKFRLLMNHYSGNHNVEEYLNWNYSEGYEVLEQEREKARVFFENALL